MLSQRGRSESFLYGAALAALGLVAASAALAATWHPLHLASGRFGYTLLQAVVFIAWLGALRVANSVSRWGVIAFVAGTAAVTLAGPPQHLTDIWNYLGYARLGAVHHLSPYSHVIANEAGDPALRHTTWRHLSSPYGPLFTAITYPLALLPLSAAYWSLKVLTVLSAVATLGAVAFSARVLGQDWRRPVVMVAASPIYLFYELNGFHNDFLMLLPMTLAVGLVVSRRERAAGAMIALAVAVKFTAVVLLPFLLVYAFARGRWGRVLSGVLLAAVPLIGLDVWLFGASIPNLSGQSGLVTGYSVVNLLGLGLGQGGATHTVELAVNAAVVGLILCLLWRARDGRGWLSGAAWATLALMLSLAWLMPWYLCWALPLVALAETPWLRRGVAAVTVFLLLTFAPYAGMVMRDARFNPMDSRVDRAAVAYQQRLQGLPALAARPRRDQRRGAQRTAPVPVRIGPEPRSVSL